MTLVTCGTCAHWTPSSFNPTQGAGLCTIGALYDTQTWPYRGYPVAAYPHVERHCAKWVAA